MTTTRMKIQPRNGNELADRPVGGRWPGWFTTDDAAALRVPATEPTCRFYRRGHAGDAVDAGELRWHAAEGDVADPALGRVTFEVVDGAVEVERARVSIGRRGALLLGAFVVDLAEPAVLARDVLGLVERGGVGKGDGEWVDVEQVGEGQAVDRAAFVCEVDGQAGVAHFDLASDAARCGGEEGSGFAGMPVEHGAEWFDVASGEAVGRFSTGGVEHLGCTQFAVEAGAGHQDGDRCAEAGCCREAEGVGEAAA